MLVWLYSKYPILNHKDIPLAKLPIYLREVNTAFEYLLEEYYSESSDITKTIDQINDIKNNIVVDFNVEEEEKKSDCFFEYTLPMYTKLPKTAE